MGADATIKLEFFWDWALERKEQKRFYGPDTIETQEMIKSPGAAKMRKEFSKGKCQNIKIKGYGTIEGYLNTVSDPSSTAFQVGGFIYSVTNNGNGTVTYRIYNQASIYSLFLHVPGLPHKPRGGLFPYGGNIDQKFEWTEANPCECQ